MKKTFPIILMLLLTSVFIFFGCRKIDRSTAKDINARIDSTGTCGFLVKVNSTGTSFNAVNLPQLYYKDSLKVVMSYHLLDTKFQCATQTVATYQEIYIDAIHKQ